MSFVEEKHIKYWRMCASVLPHHYISNDSSRMTLGFFIVSALDLLGVLDSFPPRDRQGWIYWVYQCQTPEGGFRGFTGTDLQHSRSADNSCWDPANVAATFFALATLAVLGDDLSRVKRDECLAWLPKLQREDGSFGETLSQHGRIEGDRDLRQCCCAAGIAFMLQGHEQPRRPVFDEGKLVQYVRSCQHYTGGFGVSPLREPHSGLTYCAVAALSFIGCLDGEPSEKVGDLIPETDDLIKWLVDRQTSVTDEEDVDETTEDGEDEQLQHENSTSVTEDSDHQPLVIQIAGFNGREGKIADTCYAFWNTGSLAIMAQESLVNSDALARYLLEVTQHLIGGFGKGRGDPPDILHSYLGLATLALFGQSGIKRLDPTLCMSVDAVANLNRSRWKRQGVNTLQPRQ